MINRRLRRSLLITVCESAINRALLRSSKPVYSNNVMIIYTPYSTDYEILFQNSKLYMKNIYLIL